MLNPAFTVSDTAVMTDRVEIEVAPMVGFVRERPVIDGVPHVRLVSQDLDQEILLTQEQFSAFVVTLDKVGDPREGS